MKTLKQKLLSVLSVIRRHPWRTLFVLMAFGIVAPFLCDVRVGLAAKGRVYDSVDLIPDAPVALVLGTSKIYGGHLNAFYTTRIKAAADLYKSGKIRGLIVSGDNEHKSYNEPRDMRDDLVKAGVPEEFITLDYAGFRTLDSVIRVKEVFDQDKVIIVSQRFHIERAIYLARQHGIDATGYVAKDPASRRSRLKVRAREVLARSAAVLDSIFGRDPRFLGEKETVPLKGLFRGGLPQAFN